MIVELDQTGIESARRFYLRGTSQLGWHFIAAGSDMNDRVTANADDTVINDVARGVHRDHASKQQ